MNTLIDNSTENLSMTHVLQECIANVDYDTIRIATGYWDLKAIALLLPELETFVAREGTRIMLLVGKDAYVYSEMMKNPIYKDASYPEDFIRRDLEQIATDIKDEHLDAVKFLLDNCAGDEPRLQIRRFRKNEADENQFLHSKCYIFTKEGKTNPATGIVGSSNFTKAGLQGNAELNFVETEGMVINFQSAPDAKGHVTWFTEKWELAEDWTREFLEQVLKPSMRKHLPTIERKAQQTARLTPYEVYVKYLQTQIGDIADTGTTAQLESYLPNYIDETTGRTVKFDSHAYQMDAVKQSFYIMRQHGGVFISDVVGLGKTLVGTLIIRKFIDEAQNIGGRHPNVLLIVPPAIRKGWEETISKFDHSGTTRILDYVDIVSTGSISRVLDMDDEDGDEDDNNINREEDTDFSSATKQYGLIVIDESHNFRNNLTQKYKKLTALIDSRPAGTPQPLVALLSATPQNNSPEDLKNQIYLFQREPNNTTLADVPERKLDSYFAEQIRTFKACRNNMSAESRRVLKQMADDIRAKILDHIVVRRTRTDLKKHYAEDAQKLKFPTIKGPNTIPYSMGTKLRTLFNDTMNTLLTDETPSDGRPHLGYYRYTALAYLDEETQKIYEANNLDAKRFSAQLAQMEQISLVKRLESSFVAFRDSLHNFHQNTTNMLTMLDADRVYVCPSIDVNKVFADCNYDFAEVSKELDKKISKMTPEQQLRNRTFAAADFGTQYRAGILKDLAIAKDLCEKWDKNRLDPKMDEFKNAIKNRLFDPAINTPDRSKGDEQKLVIFTEAISTQKAIAEYLGEMDEFDGKVLTVSSHNRNDMQEKIRQNFDANYDGEERNDYNVIVTTEVLAEGVNLHRANVILNYDTPWNATRLMQRIGRVNRIGSRQAEVHVFNFHPSDQGNDYIHLREKAYAKLQSFHTMFGEDSKVYSDEESLSEAYFNKLADGDESPMARHIAALKAFQAEEPARYETIKGMSLRDVGGHTAPTPMNVGTEAEPVWAPRPDVCVLGTDRGMGVGVVRPTEGQEAAHVASALEVMNALACAKDEQWTDTAEAQLPEQLMKEAKTLYLTHTTHHIHNADARLRQKAAIEAMDGIVDTLRNEGKFLGTCKTCAKAARTAIKNGNMATIRAIETFKTQREQGSLFGDDWELATWVEATFGHLTTEAEQRNGEVFVALWKTN